MKQITIFLISAVLALTLCGCAESANNNDIGAGALPSTTAPQFTEQTQAAVQEPDAEPTVPDGEPAADDDAATAKAVTAINTVTVQNQDDACTMTLTVTGCYEDGTEAWKYVSPNCCQTELDTVGFVTATDDAVYLYEQCVYVEGEDPENHGLIALDRQTGAVKWSNTDFTGANACFALSDDGVIYIGGYYGPDCVAIDKDGKTLWKYNNDLDCYWLYDITLESDHLSLAFDASDSGEGRTIYIDLDGTYLG